MLTPKRLAAALRDNPPKTTASTTRLRRSSERAIPAAPFSRRECGIRNYLIRESPNRFSPFGYRSKDRSVAVRRDCGGRAGGENRFLQKENDPKSFFEVLRTRQDQFYVEGKDKGVNFSLEV